MFNRFRKHCLWIMGYDPEKDTVTILPMNGDGSITLHGEKEARFFTDLLLDHFRKPIAERIAEAAKGPDLQEVAEHFGYESIVGWHGVWLNKPGQIERLANLPEFIKTLGLDKQYRITFDYDPAYPKMLLQAIVTSSSQ